jgi:hypothetical protein
MVLAFASDAQIEEEGIQIVQGPAIHDFLMLGAQPMSGNLLSNRRTADLSRARDPLQSCESSPPKYPEHRSKSKRD